jgi:hypothetical protein
VGHDLMHQRAVQERFPAHETHGGQGMPVAAGEQRVDSLLCDGHRHRPGLGAAEASAVGVAVVAA